MITIKRICSALLLVLLSVFLCCSALAADRPTFSAVVSNADGLAGTSVLSGENIEVAIQFRDNEHFTGMTFTLTFDPNILTPVYSDNVNECFTTNTTEVPVNYSMVHYSETKDRSSATLTIALAILDNVTISSGTVGTVHFAVKNTAPAGTYPIKFAFSANKGLTYRDKTAYYSLSANTENGSLTICDMYVGNQPVTESSAVPAQNFDLTVPSVLEADMILAGYDANGKLITVSIKSAEGTRTVFSVNNTEGNIAVIKIFTMDNFTPLLSARTLGAST